MRSEIVDQMTIVELRNYVHYLNEEKVKLRKMIQEQSFMIDAFRRLYHQESEKNAALIELNVKSDEVGHFEMDMEQKHGAEYECASEVACVEELRRQMAERMNWPNLSNGYKGSQGTLKFRGKDFNGKDLGKGE
ncbi:MAG: hypothetical protein IJT99_01265 [Clostridia bacterium]|nr:hypothetical protein [Clostridia bacterium]